MTQAVDTSILTDTTRRSSVSVDSGTSSHQPAPHGVGATAFPRMLQPKDVTALPAGVSSPHDLAGEWVIVRVRGGRERKLIILLADVARGIGYCLPMERVRRRVDGQDRGTYTRLLFPSYAFICCRHEDDYYELVGRGRCLQRIRVIDQQRFVSELDGMNLAARNGMLSKYDRRDIKKGIQCRIKRGKLQGHYGWIESVKGEDHVVIGITILGQSCPTTVPIDDVEPYAGPSR